MENSLLAVSPLDGRYADKVENLSQYFSEAALMRYRTLVEIEWFIFLFNNLKLKGTKVLDTTELRILRSIYEDFDVVNAVRVKEIEKITNHDVKAIEYFIKENLKDSVVEKYLEFIHFACTSEDINNLSYSCMIRDAVDRDFMPLLSGLVQEMYVMALKYKDVAMMARTHGQPASPTTLGKEIVNVVARLEKEMEVLSSWILLPGKMNGAVGNYNAHVVAYSDVDWEKASETFVNGLGLEFNAYTTQIEPHDGFASLFDSVKRINSIVLDFDRDMWTYISLGYFGQIVKAGEVGSSTMPHKVNPIDFENSEGNLGLSNALLSHMSEKLPVSRLQRDLTDSTVVRNVGSALAYAYLAYKSTLKGLSKCTLNKKAIEADIEDMWVLLAEPIQVVMRKNLVPDAYEKLKTLTRGKGDLNKIKIQKFIKSLDIPSADKKTLMALTPEKYIGLAAKLVDKYKPNVSVSGCGSGSCGSCGGGCS